jgi:NADH:ubiquinone oxidoreductase subunit 5 (subunit L)/multisubunit Na+/H+ antiporter MnhA subunit
MSTISQLGYMVMAIGLSWIIKAYLKQKLLYAERYNLILISKLN